MTQTDPSELQNPYAPTSEIRVHPDSIAFDGIITEEIYSKLLPRKEMVLFLTLALLLIAVALPVLIAASFFAIFVEGKVEMIVGCVGMTLFTMAALGFCIRMASTSTRARSYLKTFPDLLGAMKGTFSSKGLILDDGEKTHWFHWVQLSHLVVSEAGVRVPLGDDPRRFLALAAELFDGYQPSDMEQMRFRNKIAHINYDQLAAQSAAVFQTEVGLASFYSGWIQQPVKWSAWITLLLGPSSVCIFIVLQTVLGQWSRLEIGLFVFLSLFVLPSIRNMFQLLRNRNRTTVMCWGWLSERELIYGSGVHVMKILIASTKYIGRNAETLQFQLTSGTSLYFFRSLFRDTNHFDEISSSFDG